MNIFSIPGRQYDSNVYVIIGKNPTVIDTGTGFFSEQMLQRIHKVINLSRLQQIVLTHEHFDHVGGVNHILRATEGNAKIFAHHEIVSKLKEGKSIFAEMLGGVMPKVIVDVPLIHGQQLMVGDEPCEVLLTPGHSIGSLCVYGKKSKILFSGDTIFAHGGFGRYDFPGGDFSLLLQSLQRLAELDILGLYPGHGPWIEDHAKHHIDESLRNIQSLR